MSSLSQIIPILAGLFGKRMELCCPSGVPNAIVERYRSERLHFGRLR